MKSGSIGNIDWKHCGLETSFSFGNMDRIMETQIGYCKHIKAFGNKTLILYIVLVQSHFEPLYEVIPALK